MSKYDFGWGETPVNWKEDARRLCEGPTKESYYLKRALDELDYCNGAYQKLEDIFESRMGLLLKEQAKESFSRENLVNKLRFENRELKMKLYGEPGEVKDDLTEIEEANGY